MRRSTTLLSSLLVSLGILAGCSTNPATGQRQFNVLNTEQEVAMGNEASPQFLANYGGEIPSPAIQQYVSSIGHRLAAVSERPDLPWEFHVVDSAVINAFALPGGKVFMSRGLLAHLQNEAQLAGVLGHEVGHVTAQHIGQQMSRALGIQILAAGLQIAGEQSNKDWLRVVGAGTEVGGGVYLLKFGRDQETQADELGLRYMARNGYNPAAQIEVMQILKQASGAGGGGPEFLSTHPYPDTRIQRLEKMIPQEYPDFNQPGRYEFFAQRYQQQVLATLQRLPPPRHTGEEQQQGMLTVPGGPGVCPGCYHGPDDALAQAHPEPAVRLARLQSGAAR